MSDHYAPHLGCTFEGYYSKFTLPSGHSVCLIVSAVPAAAHHATPDEIVRNKAFYIVFTYVAPDSSHHTQYEYFPPSFDVKTDRDGFKIAWNHGHLAWDKVHDAVSWKLDTEEVRFEAETNAGSRVPWRPHEADSTPAGLIARLPSPIQWHVHSLSSDCTYDLAITGEKPERGVAKVHFEKNWAQSFPKSYIWLQARDHAKSTGVCIAGGSLIPGVQAYLVGYHGKHDRSPKTRRFLSYIPWSIFGVTLSGLSTLISYPERRFEIDIKGWFRRLKVTASAEPGTWFTFAAPLPGGHKPDYCTQTYGARIEVDVYEREGWMPWSAWKRVEGQVYENGALEFGGDAFKKHDE
jgi:hypothetical protein